MNAPHVSYVAIINNSNIDRCVVKVFENKKSAIKWLWKEHDVLTRDFKNVIDEGYNPKYTNASFHEAIQKHDNSAFIQCYDFHINFELHEIVEDPTESKQ